MSEEELMQQAKEDGVCNMEEYAVWLSGYARGISRGVELYSPILSDVVIKDEKCMTEI